MLIEKNWFRIELTTPEAFMLSLLIHGEHDGKGRLCLLACVCSKHTLVLADEQVLYACVFAYETFFQCGVNRCQKLFLAQNNYNQQQYGITIFFGSNMEHLFQKFSEINSVQ